MQNEWVATVTAVGPGGGTAAGMSMDVVTIAVGVVGATCAIASTIAAIYFHSRNYKINQARLAEEKLWHERQFIRENTLKSCSEGSKGK